MEDAGVAPNSHRVPLVGVDIRRGSANDDVGVGVAFCIEVAHLVVLRALRLRRYLLRRCARRYNITVTRGQHTVEAINDSMNTFENDAKIADAGGQ
ncbi:hypothetical protein CPC08DRAFT_713520 [Agrocybe pediades]|nr:hypothetical protein CPC08DRAFT_713520 [Agrocybe pediades]